MGFIPSLHHLRNMKYFLVSGEASGDMHGANLLAEIMQLDSGAEFAFFGGDKMAKVTGIKPINHNKDRAFMGIWEVIKNLPTIKKALKQCKESIQEFKPDVVIFIDYPGFNLKIAPFCKALGIPTHYFISPKLWAWNTKRVHKLKKNIDHLYTILPFETEFYKSFDYPVDYVGNPLMDEIEKFKNKEKSEKKILALLPGSRSHEIENMLPTMYKVAKQFPEYTPIVVGAPNFDASFYQNLLGEKPRLHFGNTYDILSIADIALVTSGTATLETGLFKVPQVVCYKFNWLSYLIGKMVIKVKYISLVNLILDKLAVKELIQYDFTEENTKLELQKLTQGEERRRMLADYDTLIKKVGGSGAAKRTAQFIYSRVHKKSDQ